MTGVQTCALPISRLDRERLLEPVRGLGVAPEARERAGAQHDSVGARRAAPDRGGGFGQRQLGAIFVEVLKKAGASLTRESFLAAAESLDASVGGLAARFSPTDHQALKKTYLTTISRGQIDLVK